jgi:hypothetical protein
VLFVLISAVWLIVAFLGLAMCRLAGLSDTSERAALIEWITSERGGEIWPQPGADADERLPIDARFRAYRATG